MTFLYLSLKLRNLAQWRLGGGDDDDDSEAGDTGDLAMALLDMAEAANALEAAMAAAAPAPDPVDGLVAFLEGFGVKDPEDNDDDDEAAAKDDDNDATGAVKAAAEADNEAGIILCLISFEVILKTKLKSQFYFFKYLHNSNEINTFKIFL